MHTASEVPTVMVPALLTDARLFQHQAESLSRFGTTTVGRTAGHRTLAGIARAVLDEAPPQFALVGVSMGGRVALEIVRRAPERVLRLALLGTSVREESIEERARRRAQIDLVQRGCFAELVDAMYPHMVHPSRHHDGALRRTFAEMASAVGPSTFVAHQHALISRRDVRESLSAIQCPTLVLVGSDDSITPVGDAIEIANGIPHAKLFVLPECGHLSTLERPEQTTAALEEWMELPALQHLGAEPWGATMRSSS